MKLAIIVPGELPSEAKNHLKEELTRIASPSTETEIFDIKGGKIRAAADIDLAVPQAVQLAVDAEKNGFDGIVLDGT